MFVQKAVPIQKVQVVQKVPVHSYNFHTGGHYAPVYQQQYVQKQQTKDRELSPTQLRQIAEIVNQTLDKRDRIQIRNSTDAVTFHCGKCHGAGKANEAIFSTSGPWDDKKVKIALGAFSGVMPDGRKLAKPMSVMAGLDKDVDGFSRVLTDLPQMPRLFPPAPSVLEGEPTLP